METIKGLEQCVWKLATQDDLSILITEERTKTGVWTCKYNCRGYDTTNKCYEPLSNFPEFDAYVKVVKEYYERKGE